MKVQSVIYLMCLGLSLAHNWMVSPSRVPFAATTFPCMNPRSIYPHVQISVDQEFQMEWAIGHDRLAYFVLVKKSDSGKLVQHKNSFLDAYINEAPQQLYGPKYQKYRRTKKSPTDTHTLGGTVQSHYKREITAGDPAYRARPTEFGDSRFQWEYSSSPNDRYVAYTSASKPWILGVWRYEIQEADPAEWDFAVFKLPPGTPPGDYIMHYLWSGYYDCIDINVLANTVVPGDVPFPYGKPINGSALYKANRVDHCIFDEPSQYITMPRLVLNGYKDSAKNCWDNCVESFDRGCSGASVFPLSLVTKQWGPHWDVNDNIIRSLYEENWNINAHINDGLFYLDGFPNDRLGAVNSTYSLYSGIWRETSYDGVTQLIARFNQTTLDAVRTWVETQSNDPWVCLLVASRSPTSTVDKYTVTDDPLDPVWYSTCYAVEEQYEFIGYSGVNIFSPDVSATALVGNCVSCADVAMWQTEAYTPEWKLSSCRLCERDEPNPVIPHPFLAPLQIKGNLRISTSLSYPYGPTGDTSCVLPPEWNISQSYAQGGSDWLNYCIRTFEYVSPYYTYGGKLDDGTQVGYLTHDFDDTLAYNADTCLAYINTFHDGLCSSVFSTIPGARKGCSCLIKEPCCYKYLRFQNSATESIWERKKINNDPLLDPNCTRGLTGLRSTEDPKYCCMVPEWDRKACGSNGCSLTNGISAIGGLCKADQIPPTRLCTEFAPPCIVP